MVEILTNLLLGSMSDVLYILGKSSSIQQTPKVTHLLSILNKPIDWSQIHTSHGTLVAKLLVAPDIPSSDLLTHFPSCVSYINDALADNGTILVHCEYGISRSATIVLAYLMKVKKLNYTQAIEFLQEKKPDIRPNSGFVHQLKLWYTMSWTLDESNKTLRAYRLHHQARIMKEAGYMETMNMITDPISITTTTAATAVGVSGEDNKYYSCRKCRRLLFSDKDILQHELGSGFEKRQDMEDFWSTVIAGKNKTQNEAKKKEEKKKEEESHDDITLITDGFKEKVTITDQGESQRIEELQKLRTQVAQIAARPSHDSHTTCSSLFIEPVEWMGPLLIGHKDGKLLCPKCSARLGSFDWAGSQCSCGRWVTPSFQIHKSRIDFKLIK